MGYNLNDQIYETLADGLQMVVRPATEAEKGQRLRDALQKAHTDLLTAYSAKMYDTKVPELALALRTVMKNMVEALKED